MVGYLVNAKLGARLYNLVHADALPLALAALSLDLRQSGLLAFALIWLSHIGADRALGSVVGGLHVVVQAAEVMAAGVPHAT